MSDRRTGELPLGAKAYTLKELGELLAPRTYRYWLLAADLLAELQPAPGTIESDDPQAVPVFSGASRIDWVWAPGSPLRLKGGRPHIVKSKRARRDEIEGRRRALARRIAARILDAIGSPGTTTAGVGPAGVLGDISRVLAPQLLVDLDGNTLSTMDGRRVWCGVVVRVQALTAADADPVPQAKPKAAVGGNRAKDDRASLAKVKAALKNDRGLSMRGAILKLAVPPNATASQQDAIVRRLTKKLNQRS